MEAMQAACLNGHGGNEAVVVGKRPKPARRPGEVLVRMTAAGLNQVDLYMRNSGAGITHELPMILGLDGAGTVVETDAASTFQPGDPVVIYPARICGGCAFCLCGEEVLCTGMKILGEHIDGTFAEFVCLPEGNLFAKPQHLDDVRAASLCVAWLTAWRMICTRARINPWETVLVFGIGGSVSLAGLQILSAMGVRTIVTSRDQAKLNRAEELGADACVLTGDENFGRRIMDLTGGRGVDVVFENVGKAVWPLAMKALVRGGRIVTCGATSGDDPSADLRRLFIRQLQVIGSTLGNRSEFADLLAFVGHNGIEPHIDSEFPLGEMHAALDRLESGQQFGKIGIRIAGA